jgi:hypothetical protein
MEVNAGFLVVGLVVGLVVDLVVGRRVVGLSVVGLSFWFSVGLSVWLYRLCLI